MSTSQTMRRVVALLVFAAVAFIFSAPALATGEASWQQCLQSANPDGVNQPYTGPAVGIDSYPITERAPKFIDTNPAGDEVVIDFSDDLSNDRIKRFGEKRGLELTLNSDYSDAANVFVADVEEGAVPTLRTCLNASDKSSWIQAVDENVQYIALGDTPNDPLYQFQWNFDQINAEQAWSGSTGDGVVVAVIDTGVAFDEDPSRDITRPKDLEGTAQTGGYDFVDDDSFAWDGHGHGTHVAGTVAQTTNNGYGVAGVAYDASIMPLRVLNGNGFGQISDIADAIRYAADNGADVINMSLGGPIPSLVLKRAINYAHKRGVTIVAAAGNSGKRAPSFPAAYKHVIAVSATQYDRSTTFYSQWGKFVDIAAPGGNTRVDQNGDGRPDGVMQQTLKDGQTDKHDFILYMGTSMASPHVAAASALVESTGVTHPDRVEEALQDAANQSERDEFDNPTEYKEKYGAGILNTAEAVQDARNHQGGFRLGFGLLMALTAFFGIRRKDRFGRTADIEPFSFTALSGVFAGGLFFLPMLFGSTGVLGSVASLLSHPVSELDLALFGAGIHQNAALASVLVPLTAYAFAGSRGKWTRTLVSSLAIGTAAFCLAEVYLMTSDVQWIPGMGLLDRAWLGINGLLSFGLGYLILKRR